MTLFTPAEVVEQTGFSLDTLRYYERVGLLSGVARSASGHRRFTDDDLQWLGVLRCLRDTGMPIAEMRRYAELAQGGDETMDARRILLEAHDARVEEQINDLRVKQAAIRRKIDYYYSVSSS